MAMNDLETFHKNSAILLRQKRSRFPFPLFGLLLTLQLLMTAEIFKINLSSTCCRFESEIMTSFFPKLKNKSERDLLNIRHHRQKYNNCPCADRQSPQSPSIPTLGEKSFFFFLILRINFE